MLVVVDGNFDAFSFVRARSHEWGYVVMIGEVKGLKLYLEEYKKVNLSGGGEAESRNFFQSRIKDKFPSALMSF